jgi:hypothetical protein
MKIKISKLRDLAVLVLSSVQHQLGSEWVEIPADYYWDVVGAGRYQFNGGTPPTPDYKALVDDCHQLISVPGTLDSWTVPAKVPLLVPLSNLLRAIGDHPDALSRVDAPSGARVVCDPES